MQLGEHREKIERETGIKRTTLHRFLDAPYSNDPPAIKDPALGLGEHPWCRLLLHDRLSCVNLGVAQWAALAVVAGVACLSFARKWGITSWPKRRIVWRTSACWAGPMAQRGKISSIPRAS